MSKSKHDKNFEEALRQPVTSALRGSVGGALTHSRSSIPRTRCQLTDGDRRRRVASARANYAIWAGTEHVAAAAALLARPSQPSKR